MNFLGIEIEIRNVPELDPGFIPLGKLNEAFLRTARKPLGIAVERSATETAAVETFIHGTPGMLEADRYYVRRLVKTLLWMKGGYRVCVTDERIADWLRGEVFCPGGIQEFDYAYFRDLYGRGFTVEYTPVIPGNRDNPRRMGGHFDGCRIGFDAGGSDRKVSAVADGEVVFDEETVWFPKLSEDPKYQYDGIVAGMRAAAEHMPRVDAVGVSTAGIVIDNQVLNSSLFIKVPKALWKDSVYDVYTRAVRECFGDVPCVVLNDGDVTALAGAMSLDDGSVLGIAMGTSEAGGFVDDERRVMGWLNELAFIPVDANPAAMKDEWSLDIGCGVKYFSQDGVIKLAAPAGIELDPSLSPAEKLKAVQKLMEADNPGARKVYEGIGCCLAHSLAYYHSLYGFRHVLLLGRVMSGRGGDLLLSTCRAVLADEYPGVASEIALDLPDEKFRRLGQSAAAAALPVI